MVEWSKTKKKNHEKRVDLYSHPGVGEVILKDEWQRPNRYTSYSVKEPWSKGDIIFLIIIVVIFIGIIKWFVW